MHGDEINFRPFDALIEKIVLTTANVVVYKGAGFFTSLSRYFISNQVSALLKELGHEMMMHTANHRWTSIIWHY